MLHPSNLHFLGFIPSSALTSQMEINMGSGFKLRVAVALYVQFIIHDVMLLYI